MPILSEELDLRQVLPWFEKQLLETYEKKGIPGFAAGVVYQGKTVWIITKGVRSSETKEPVTHETVFQLGSVSKPIAGTLIGVLLQNKKITLEDRVRTHIPDFIQKQEEPITQHIDSLTIKHLLTHTSGIPRFGFNALIEKEIPQDEIFSRLLRSRNVTPPGTSYDYHNVAYALQSLVVENVTGMSYNQALKTLVLDPLMMIGTTASLEGLMASPNRASPHIKTEKGFKVCKKYSKGYYTVAPAGGINSNVKDMCTFLGAHMGHRLDVLSSNTLQTLHTPYTYAKDIFEKNPGNTERFKGAFYGIGWRILVYQGHKIIFHGGWVRGFINIIAFIPDKQIGIVILQNADTSFPWVMAMTFFDKILGIEGRRWEKESPMKKPVKRKQS